MADELLNGDDDDIFVYTGGDQEVPRDVKRVSIAENVDTVPREVFLRCEQLIEVVGHNKLKKIERRAFWCCRSLRRVKNMNGIKEIENDAFLGCTALSELEFDKLENIGNNAFAGCKSLRSINLPSIRTIGACAFQGCTALTDAVFGKDLGSIEWSAFHNCTALRRIAIPLKHNLIVSNDAFNRCDNLSRVDIVGVGIHKTVSSLHMKSWRDEMREAIDQINQTLANEGGRSRAINTWIELVLCKIDHYKEEHRMVVEEAMTILELALWKVKLLDEEGERRFNLEEEGKKAKKVSVDDDSTRKEHRVTCGANIVIKNVLPFLVLSEI